MRRAFGPWSGGGLRRDRSAAGRGRADSFVRRGFRLVVLLLFSWWGACSRLGRVRVSRSRIRTLLSSRLSSARAGRRLSAIAVRGARQPRRSSGERSTRSPLDPACRRCTSSTTTPAAGASTGRLVWPTFRNACAPYDGPALVYLVAACKAPDGSYWALQRWQRGLPLLGFNAVAAVTDRVRASSLPLERRPARGSRCRPTGRTATRGTGSSAG